ncbi:MAG: MSMEG_4193 family putative phosphomutase [Actinobacteria bacterium]|nr:MSMEG_4193 family putative phosphomutase [Actinomycetota bacterium]
MGKPKPSTTRVVLVRHGVTAETGRVLSGQLPGIHLSEDGKAQAKAVAERLALARVAAVYASPLERTRQTAEIIADPHDLPIRDLPGVIDFDVGEWAGRELKQLMKEPLWPVIMAAPSRVVFPGGEGLAAMQARAVAAVDGVVQEHAGETVIVVAHADIIKAVVAHAVGLHLDLFQRLVVAPASITILSFFGPVPVLELFNDTGAVSILAAPGPEKAR